jgi:hypothetical protein
VEVVVAKHVLETAGLTVRAIFQPGRISKMSLALAYDRLLPTRHASMSSNRGMEPKKEGNDEQNASSDLRASEFREAS